MGSRDGIGFSRKPHEALSAIMRRLNVRSVAELRTWFAAATAAQRDRVLLELLIGLTSWPEDAGRSPYDLMKDRIG